MYTPTIIATTLLAALAGAQSAPQTGYFFLFHEPNNASSPEQHLHELKAHKGYFYVNANGTTTASCATDSSTCCTANNRTSFATLGKASTSGPLYLNTAGLHSADRRQRVYCESGGLLKYTGPGAVVPYDSPWSNFTYTPPVMGVKDGQVKAETTFKVCNINDGNGLFMVYCNDATGIGGLSCTDTTLTARFDFSGVAAGQYD